MHLRSELLFLQDVEESLNTLKCLGNSGSNKVNEMSKLILFSYTYLNRYNGNNKLRSSLLLALEELKKHYISMRMKVKMGVPLSALPPLSVEMKLFPISSSYVPCQVIS